MSENGSKDRLGLAEDRTDWAEDRTILANERTFAGWLRTGMAAVGVGLGFQAIFRAVEPTWAAKAVATFFAVVGIFVFLLAYRQSAKLLKRLNAHSANPAANRFLGLLALALSAGSLMLIAVVWLLL